jgi:hypothetical protein
MCQLALSRVFLHIIFSGLPLGSVRTVRPYSSTVTGTGSGGQKILNYQVPVVYGSNRREGLHFSDHNYYGALKFGIQAELV